jgi:hypothetical protein
LYAAAAAPRIVIPGGAQAPNNSEKESRSLATLPSGCFSYNLITGGHFCVRLQTQVLQPEGNKGEESTINLT